MLFNEKKFKLKVNAMCGGGGDGGGDGSGSAGDPTGGSQGAGLGGIGAPGVGAAPGVGGSGTGQGSAGNPTGGSQGAGLGGIGAPGVGAAPSSPDSGGFGISLAGQDQATADALAGFAGTVGGLTDVGISPENAVSLASMGQEAAQGVLSTSPDIADAIVGMDIQSSLDSSQASLDSASEALGDQPGKSSLTDSVKSGMVKGGLLGALQGSAFGLPGMVVGGLQGAMQGGLFGAAVHGVESSTGISVPGIDVGLNAQGLSIGFDPGFLGQGSNSGSTGTIGGDFSGAMGAFGGNQGGNAGPDFGGPADEQRKTPKQKQPDKKKPAAPTSEPAPNITSSLFTNPDSIFQDFRRRVGFLNMRLTDPFSIGSARTRRPRLF